jgi:putative membrane protein
MMGFDGYGVSPWMWILGSLMMVVFMGGLILLVVWAVRTIGGPRPASSDSALEVLKRRLAAGEITQDEYEKTRRVLQG